MSNQSIAVNRQPIVIRLLAQFFSYIFHPLFIPIYVSYFLIYIHPNYFDGFNNYGGFTALSKKRVFIEIILNVVMFPLIAVLLLKGLGFIQSIFLKTQKDRIIPYMSSMIFFFWAYYAFREQDYIPRILVAFLFGVFISSAAGLIANIYYKISMHAIGMGGMLGLFLVVMQQRTMFMAWPLCMALLFAGIVCTSRMIVSDHTTKDIYMGLLVGLLCQFAGAVINL